MKNTAKLQKDVTGNHQRKNLEMKRGACLLGAVPSNKYTGALTQPPLSLQSPNP